jgi:hypothetical protein
MTITAVKELWQGREGEWSEDQRSYTRVFRVETDYKYHHAGDIETNIQIPKIGMPFPADYNARCVSVVPRSESFSPYIWLTTCVYRSKGKDEGSPPEFDPTSDRAVIRWNTEAYQRVCEKAYWVSSTADDAPPPPQDSPDIPKIGVVNSAGDPFDPPVMVDDCRFGVTVTKNLATVPTWILNYVNAINDDEVTIDNVVVPMRSLKVMSVSVGDWRERNWTSYREVSMAFSVETVSHVRDVLDAGFREKSGLRVIVRKNIVNDDGSRISSPALLDGNGKKLDDPQPEDAIYMRYGVYPEGDFNVLKNLLGF